MEHNELEVLSALVDGERVDPAELSGALEIGQAKSFLVDCARLRWQLGQSEPPRSSWVRETRRHLAGRAPVWLAAAGIAATLLIGMLVIGRQAPNQVPEGLPEPDRVIRFEPGRDWSG